MTQLSTLSTECNTDIATWLWCVKNASLKSVTVSSLTASLDVSWRIRLGAREKVVGGHFEHKLRMTIVYWLYWWLLRFYATDYYEFTRLCLFFHAWHAAFIPLLHSTKFDVHCLKAMQICYKTLMWIHSPTYNLGKFRPNQLKIMWHMAQKCGRIWIFSDLI